MNTLMAQAGNTFLSKPRTLSPGLLLMCALCALTGLVVFGCERTPAQPEQAESAAVHIAETRSQPLQPKLIQKHDPLTGRTREHALFALPYAPAQEVRTDVALNTEEKKLAKDVRAHARSLNFSACLSKAAHAYASYHPHHPSKPPPRPVLEAFMHGAGCPDSSAATRLYFTTDDGTAGFQEHLAGVLAEPDINDFTHIGIGRAPGDANPYRWTWVILMTRRKFEMAALPRSMPLGEKATLRFSLREDLKTPEVLHMARGGDVEVLTTSSEGGGSYLAQVPYGPQPGEQWVEIMAEGPLGPEVVALFPVYAGETPAQAWSGWMPLDESWLTHPRDAERLMFDLVNQDRNRYGLPTLEWDEDLARVARGHSLDMAENDYFAHTSPHHGTLSDRLEMARYEARFSAENIARNPSIYDAEAGLMQSLGHRANILSPEATHLGVGIVELGHDAQSAYIITQNFARPILRLSEAALRRFITTEIERHRKHSGLPSIHRTNTLDGVANDAAQFAVQHGFTGDAINARIARKLKDNAIPFRRFRIQFHPILEASDLALPDALSKTRVRSVGVGIVPMTSDEGYSMSATLILMIEPPN